MEQEKILSLLNELKSHPDKLLFDHLKNVGNLSKIILESKKLNIDKFIDSEILKDIIYLIGITHDFGKATKFFQKYITEEDEKIKFKLKNKQETHHAFLSSLFTYYVIKDYLSGKGLIEKEYLKYLPIISFLVVKRHHGNLDNAKDETYFDDNDEEIIKKQINVINFDKLDVFYKKLYPNYGTNIGTFKDKYKQITSEINNGIRGQRKLIMELGEESSLFYYFATLLLYSILLDADKTDAANLKSTDRKNIQSAIVDNYKKLKFGKPKNKINRIRENIYSEVISKVSELNLDNDKILSLNVPTGTGKTLTSLSFALKLRERLNKEKGFSSRIIYSLPFLSIIDQNANVFDEVLENPTTDILLKHHHLSEISYKTENEFENIETEKDIGKSLLLIEGWNSEIIVTTFMQFFYSIITNRNRAIRKFHNITNSIVILDEVQAIPHKYWVLLKESIRFFAESFNTYFVFVTATQPLIFNEEKKEIKPLIKNKKEYFEKLDRFDLIPTLEPLKIENFKEQLKKDLSQNHKKDFMIVMNTINSSKEIYNFIRDNIDEIGDSKIYYLSTNIIPIERLKRIKEIKEKTKKRKIIVSTQLIEAGVDIDVDIVYRDFAPLDSINQVAGRCNRNFENDKKGKVKLVILTDENNRAYHKYIYESFIVDKTQKVFEELKPEEYKNIDEPKFLELNSSYFEKVNKGMSKDKSNEILDHVKKLEFAGLSEFKLIEEAPNKVDVFVELNEEAKKIMQIYKKIVTNKNLNPFEKKNKFLKIKKNFYDYVISVNINNQNQNIFNNLEFIGDLKIITKDFINEFYDKEIGFNYKFENFI